jgi:VanZ family protein
MKPVYWFIPPILVFLGILILSTAVAIPFQVEGVGYLDKIEHTFAYLVLVATFIFAFHRNGILSKNSLIILMASCCMYGISLEIIQYTFFPNRYFEWLDALANVVGVLIGSLIINLLNNGED